MFKSRAGSFSENCLVMNERTIFSRPHSGSAASVWQARALLTRRITIDQATLLLVKSGQKVLCWQDNEICLNAGDMVVIGSGNTFDVTNIPGEPAGRFEASWISFCNELLQNAGARPLQPVLQTAAHRVAAAAPAFCQAFQHAFDALSDSESIPQAVAVKRMEEMLSWLDAYQIFFPQPRSQGMTGRIRQQVTGNIAWPWSAADTAKAMAVSEATLRRHLKAEGTSFSRLVSDIRMEYALTLLQVTDRPVTRISLEVGYENPSKFSARFRQRFGFSPGQVRSENFSLSIPSLPTPV